MMDWISLFQNSDENRLLHETEVGQYSCTKLLREMEAAESESEGGDIVMNNADEEELVHLPEAWLENLADKKSGGGLPNNLRTLPELQEEGKFEGKEDSNADGGQNRKGEKNSGGQSWWRRGQVGDQKMVEQ
jgi:hypothetical protein